ncbi:MAG: c-type cytochrome [Gammaproteobacteria bacterium]
MSSLLRRCWLGAAVVFCSVGWLGEVFAESGKNSPHVNYMLHCQGCHLPGGVGHPGLVPALAGNVGKFLAVPEGRAYLVQVPGSAQSNLDDGELAEVLNWLIPEFDATHTPENFKRYTADEIKRYRSVRIRNVTRIRTGLLGEYEREN